MSGTGAGERVIEVVVTRLDPAAGWVAELAAACTPEERRRAARLPREELGRRVLLARGVLRLLLAERLGVAPERVSLHREPGGRLRTDDDPDLHFNHSRSRGLAVYAFRRGAAVGVDVEALDASLDVAAVARLCFPPGELLELGEAPPGERHVLFFRGWCRKEALLKAQGTGLDRVLHELGGSPAGIVAHSPWPYPGEPGWAVCDLDLASGYAAAVVSRGTAWRPVVVQRPDVFNSPERAQSGNGRSSPLPGSRPDPLRTR